MKNSNLLLPRMLNTTSLNYFFLLLFVIAFFSPKISAQDRYPLYNYPYNFLKISEPKEDGSYTLELQTQVIGYEFDVKEMLLKRDVNVYLNKFHTITFNAVGSIVDKTTQSVSLKGGLIKVDLLNDKKDIETISIKEDAAMFPEKYSMKGFSNKKLEIDRLVINYFKPDSMALVNVFSQKKIVKIEHPQAGEKDLMIPNQNIIYPVGEGAITVFFPVKSDDDNESYLKNFDFVTYNKNLEVQNIFNVSCAMPREYQYELDVFDAANLKNIIGKVVVFRKKGGSSKKSMEPYKNLYEIIYFDNTGNLILHKTTKLGTTEKRRVKVEAAFGTNNSLELILKTNVDNVDHVGILSFDKEGNETSKLTTETELISKITIVEDLKPIANIQDRAKAGVYNVALGYSAGISSEFKCSGIIKTTDGDLLVYGQRMFELVSSEKLPSGQYKTTTEEKYAEFLCFQYGADFTLRKLYISNLPMTGSQSPIKPIANEEGKIIFSIPVPIDKASRPQMFTENGESVKVYFHYYDYQVKLLQIDTKAIDAKVLEHTDFIIAHPSRGLMADEKNNKIHLFGIETVKDEGDYLINSIVSY